MGGGVLVEKFRVYPERDRFRYYTVFIFPSKRAMYTFFRSQANILNSDGTRRCDEECNFAALATHWTKFHIASGADRTKDVEDPRNIGQVLFHRKKVSASIVSHEMTHAALFWANREGLEPREVMAGNRTNAIGGDCGSAHERVCYVQGNLVRQFWLRWWKIQEK